MLDGARKLAVVTGASTGIGLELARECAKDKWDLIIAANEPEIETAANELRREGGQVETVQADLATLEGVDALYAKIGGRPVGALLANAGRGLGKAFLDQDFNDVRYVIDTNITGTVYLIQKVGRDMRDQGDGRILITGSIAGYIPGSYQAVYNGTKAFLDSFSYALGEELKDTRHCYLFDARCHRDRVFPPCRHAGHEGRHPEKGRSCGRGEERLRGDDGG